MFGLMGGLAFLSLLFLIAAIQMLKFRRLLQKAEQDKEYLIHRKKSQIY